MSRQQWALVYRTLPRDVAARTFDALDPAVQADLVKGLPEVGEDSIGRRMSPELITLRPSMAVAEALEAVNTHLDDAQSTYTLPVVEDDRRIAGGVSLRDLLRASESTRLADLLQEPDLAVAEEAARPLR